MTQQSFQSSNHFFPWFWEFRSQLENIFSCPTWCNLQYFTQLTSKQQVKKNPPFPISDVADGGRMGPGIFCHTARNISVMAIKVFARRGLNKSFPTVFSSADDVSSAELMVLLICPSSVRRRPSVNFCFKSLLLLQFLFDHSEFFTGETSHIVPPCNKAGI